MALHRLSGIENDSDAAAFMADDGDVSTELQNAVHVLLYYNVLNTDGSLNQVQLVNLENELQSGEYKNVVDCFNYINQAAIGGLFKSILRGVKKVIFLVPRNAFRLLVTFNVFGLATKINKAISDQKGHDKVYDLWYNKFGGDWDHLTGSVNIGVKKKPILGATKNQVGTLAAVVAALTAATPIIVAITGVLNNILNRQRSEGVQFSQDELTAMNMQPGTTGGGVMDWIKQNPLIVAGGAFVIYKLFIAKKTA